MQRCLNGLIFQILLVYLDDIIIYSETLKKTPRVVGKGLCTPHGTWAQAETSKCCFLRERLTYVGHELSADGVSPDPDKAAAVAEWKVPSSVKELSSFLGVAGYYRHGFAQIEGPLHKLVNSCLHKLKTKKLLIIPFENR